MADESAVLVSWIAAGHDPFNPRDGEGESNKAGGKRSRGPSLTLLLDPDSPYRGRIGDWVLLHRVAKDDGNRSEPRAIRETCSHLKAELPRLNVHREAWRSEDPTDHAGIFAFLRSKLPRIRQRFPGRELVVHFSPGTPQMQTVWMVMAETGFIPQPFKLVQSLRGEDRKGRAPVVEVQPLGIETFFQAYKESRPRQVASDDQRIWWDLTRFRSARMKELLVDARRFAQVTTCRDPANLAGLCRVPDYAACAATATLHGRSGARFGPFDAA